jgi:hypothetical protein
LLTVRCCARAPEYPGQCDLLRRESRVDARQVSYFMLAMFLVLLVAFLVLVHRSRVR